MTQTIAVQIRPDGSVQALDSGVPLPIGKAYLTWETEISSDVEDVWSGAEMLQLSEAAFSDWLTPEEDEAWAHLQQAR